MKKSLACTLLAIGVSALCCIPAAAQEILRFNYDVAGDSKPIVLHADEMTTWIEGAERILIFKGKVLVEHGGVQIQTQEAVAWLDQEEYRKTGIQRLEIYAEGNVVLENGTESQTAGKALIRLSTRGEIKLHSHDGQVTQQAQPGDPLYQRAKQQRSGQSKMSASEPIQQAAFHEIAPGPAEVIADSQIILTQGQTLPPASEGVAPALQPPAPGFPPPVTAPAAPVTAPGSPVGLPPGISVLPDVRPSQIIVPPQPFSNPLLNTPGREFSIVPRTSGGFNPQSFDLNGETAIVITGGVILIVRTQDGSGLLDMEADRLVFWTRGNAQELLSNLRTPQGQTRRDLEFYLSGNVQIRSRSGKEERFLQAEEVYYDVGRNVAVAIRADMEIREPGIPDPLHMKAEELLQLNERTFKGMKAEVFSSRLPSDPGLKVYVTEGTLVQTTVPRLTIFGRQFINRVTGQPETHEQRLFDGKDAIIKLEDYPIFYLPFIRGDVNDPLGPLESVSFNYNRIFGFQFTSSFNVYNLLGIDPIPNTRWRFDVDYMSARGPALGSEFDYSGKEFFGLPAIVTGQAKAYGIDDTGKDQLGGFRGPDDHHPEGRGRFFWRQSVQDLPQGFSIQSQFSVLSDKNFLEQYWKNEFDTDHNQETFIYVKQQQNNWAWTFLT